MNSCVACADTGMTHQNEELFWGADQAENPLPEACCTSMQMREKARAC